MNTAIKQKRGFRKERKSDMVNTKVYKVFLRAVALALNGKPYTRCPSLTGEEWQMLLDLSRNQNMLSLVYDALAQTAVWEPEDKNPVCARFHREAQLLMIRQVRKSVEFEEDYRSFQELGVDTIVVKGVICRDTYPNPDLRPSADEDFLVRPDELVKLDNYLMWKGFIRDKEIPKGEIPDEMGYVNLKRDLYYEIHTQLFKDSKAFGDYNKVFEDAREHSVCVTADGVKFRTLDHTEHLFFLLTHLLKHFIHGGVGVRQACDLFTFSRKWSEQIDWEKMRGWIVSYGLETFWMNLLELGQRVLGFSPAEYGMCTFKGIRTDSKDMLFDMLDAGVFGTSTEERQHSANMTERAAEGVGGLVSGVLRSLFPQREYMEGVYPFVKGKPWLLPKAYGMRIAGYLKRKKEVVEKGGHEEKSALTLGRERTRMLKKYRIGT